MDNNLRLGFIGFGEAGFHLAKGLRGAGLAHAVAYDIHTHTPGRGERIRERARETGVTLVESSAALAAAADVLLSVVVANAASEAAEQTAPYLHPRHLYADLNSVSPQTKQNVDRVVRARGARFVEVAVMAPVPPHLHRVPMLLGGGAATEFFELMSPYGLRMEVMSEQVGSAVAVKMCRSIMVKGIEALVFECVMAASRFGADERVLTSLNETFPGKDWNQMADYLVGRVAVHGERRAREMEEVAETLRGIGIEPIMAEATARRQQFAATLGLREHFGPEGPKTYRETLQAIDEIQSARS